MLQHNIEGSSNGSIGGLLHKMYTLCPGLLLDWISVPPARVSDIEKSCLLNGFRSDVGRDEFLGVVDRFVEVYSRSQKMGLSVVVKQEQIVLDSEPLLRWLQVLV